MTHSFTGKGCQELDMLKAKRAHPLQRVTIQLKVWKTGSETSHAEKAERISLQNFWGGQTQNSGLQIVKESRMAEKTTLSIHSRGIDGKVTAQHILFPIPIQGREFRSSYKKDVQGMSRLAGPGENL